MEAGGPVVVLETHRDVCTNVALLTGRLCCAHLGVHMLLGRRAAVHNFAYAGQLMST